VLALLLLVVVGVIIWLAALRRRAPLTADHVITGGTIVGVSALVLFGLSRVSQIHINAYGAMLMLGFVAGTLIGIALGRRRGITADRVLDLGLVILLGAIVGARVVYVILTPGTPLLPPLGDLLNQGLGGLSFHGGVLGALLTGGIYIVRNKLSFWRVADAFAPAVALGYAITRIGYFLNGCCYGMEAHALPWAVVFPNLHDSVHRHPTQLYAVLMGLIMFGILLWLSRGNGLRRAGRLFMAFLMLEGVERYVMEIFRAPDPSLHLAPGLQFYTPAQLFSILLVILGIIGWFLLPKNPAVVESGATPERREQSTSAAR
jgi:phosphatidylglycerol:prolipoprotein diacylglycerol transferase